ncbi:uncharacterized protein LOC123032489 [Varanus komodoensis]|uniref:uncharacterized protein LOC123032489 n=1 Tax=Varanus komodoensis TaxID=61221 RepID=UPI001CF778D0|nr:uncharacterized protein LOC123032489 [Varanus komodoensis]
MTETARGCGGPEAPAEACVSCQVPAGTLDPAMRDEAALNTDQEMQWASAREDSPLQAPSLNNQLFLALPHGLRADLCGSQPTDGCEDLPGESPEDMPPEPPCEEMSSPEPPGAPCRGRCRGSLCEELCTDIRKVPTQRLFEEDPCGEPWPGKARLPSIVVEPSEGGDVESGELRWPPADFSLLEEAERDELFAEGEEARRPAGLSSFESDVEELLL